jgi:hypothetical protein
MATVNGVETVIAGAGVFLWIYEAGNYGDYLVFTKFKPNDGDLVEVERKNGTYCLCYLHNAQRHYDEGIFCGYISYYKMVRKDRPNILHPSSYTLYPKR